MLSSFTVMAAVASLVTIVPGPAASAADEITCATPANVWAIRSNNMLHQHGHNDPKNGVDSWSFGGREQFGGWPAATWAGPGGRMYYLNAFTGTLERHRWNGSSWENGAVSKPIRDNMGYYADPANAKRLTIDVNGVFYMADENGVLFRRTYDENAKTWDSLEIDGDWNRYDAIFAAGDGVLWAREPNGAMFRFRYHAGSQRWLQHRQPIPGIAWEQYRNLTSPGGDVIYGIRNSDSKIVWWRYEETRHYVTPGAVIGQWWGDSINAIASPDSCKLDAEPNPGRPVLGTPNRTAKAALLKTDDGYLQYAYIDGDGKAVHAKVTDLYNVGPNGFATLPDTSGFTGTPALAENANGDLRLYAQGTDADVRAFGKPVDGNWAAPNNRAGRMVTPPQGVRTADGRVSFFALSLDGYLWTKFQTTPNGPVYPWRKFSSLPIMSRNLTIAAVGNAIHVVARHSFGEYCKLTVQPGSVTDWTCGGITDIVGAVAVVPMPENTLQLVGRHSNGKIYTTRFQANGTIPTAWTQIPGELPAGVTAAGEPAALMAPNGTLQVVVRGSDGFTYRTGQVASGSTSWHPWTEIYKYAFENAVDPTLSLAENTWVIAFRTPANEPRLLRWSPTTPSLAAAKTASTEGEFAVVPLHR